MNLGTVPRPSRHRRPKSGIRGVHPVWSEEKWKWRAFVRRAAGDPPQRVGPYRDTKNEAAEDYLRIAREWDEELRSLAGNHSASRHLKANPRATFGQALDLVIERARQRGAGDYYIEHQLKSVDKYLRKWIAPARALALIGVDDIVLYARDAHADGRHVNTIRTKDLPQIDRAFRCAGVPSPIPAAREQLALRAHHAPKAPLKIQEVRSIIRRIRKSDRKKYPQASRHADILELTWQTGIRSGEFARLTADDLDVANCVVHVRRAKNRARPRSLPVPARLRPVLKRLKDQADPETGLLVKGGMASIGALIADWKDRLGERRLNMRNLRRAAASHLARKKWATVDVSKVLGHTSTVVTERYIASLLEVEELREIMASLDDD